MADGALPDQEMCEHCSSWGPDGLPCHKCGASWPQGGVRCSGGHVVSPRDVEGCVYCDRGEPAHG